MKFAKYIGSFVSCVWVMDVSAYDTLAVKYYEVGPGNCVFIQCPGPNDVNLLLDCGSHRVEQKDRVLGDLLTTAQNSTTNVILTHSDKDHHNWLKELFNDWTYNDQTLPMGSAHVGDKWGKYKQPTGSIIQLKANATIYGRQDINSNANPVINESIKRPRPRPGAAVETFTYQEVRRLDISGLAAGDQPPQDIGVCDEADVRILAGNSYSQQFGNKTNPQSLVVSLSWQNRHFIFPGDATNEANDQALKKALKRWGKVQGVAALNNFSDFNSNLKVDVMMAPHHGSDVENSNWNGWAKVTRPDHLIFSGDPSTSNGSLRHPTYNAYTPYEPYLKAAPEHPMQVKLANANTYKDKVANKRRAYTDTRMVSKAVFGLHDVSDVTVTVFRQGISETKGRLEVDCNHPVCGGDYFDVDMALDPGEVDVQQAGTKLVATDSNGIIGGDQGEVVVTLLDRDGQPIPNKRVKLVAISGRAKFSPLEGDTDANGQLKTAVEGIDVGEVYIAARFDSNNDDVPDKNVVFGSPAIVNFAVGG